MGSERLAGLVARRLGVDRPAADRLVELTRTLAPDRYRIRAASFVLATHGASSRLLPRRVRERALGAFLGPMLSHPRALNLYAEGRDESALARDEQLPCET